MHPRVVELHERVLTGELSRRGAAREYGLNRGAMDRHWAKHVPAAMRDALARNDAQPKTVAMIQGDALLGQATDVYERAVALFDTLEAELLRGGMVDRRAVVAALKEQRGALETVAKLAFAVQDRGSRGVETERPGIDAAIIEALEARDFAVTETAQPQYAEPPQLEAGPAHAE